MSPQSTRTTLQYCSVLPAEIMDRLQLAGGVGELELKMHSSDATARQLVTDRTGLFGADLLRFPPGGRVPMHIHAGDHILFVLGGEGALLYGDGDALELRPGVIYFVEQDVPHEIAARTELVLLVIGNQRRPPDDPARLDLVTS